MANFRKMKINKKYNGTIIGLIFTILCLLLTFTFIIPILSLCLGIFVEFISEDLANNTRYSHVGKTTILLLSIIFLVSIILIFIDVRRKSKVKNLSNDYIIIVMMIEYFIVHPLGFYIYWAIELNFKADGQLAFGAFISYPFSSLSFFIIGILIDIIKRKPIQNI